MHSADVDRGVDRSHGQSCNRTEGRDQHARAKRGAPTDCVRGQGGGAMCTRHRRVEARSAGAQARPCVVGHPAARARRFAEENERSRVARSTGSEEGERNIRFRQAVAAESILRRSVESASRASGAVCRETTGSSSAPRRCRSTTGSRERLARARAASTPGRPSGESASAKPPGDWRTSRPQNRNRSPSRYRPRSSRRTRVVQPSRRVSRAQHDAGVTSQPPGVVVHRRRYRGANSSRRHGVAHR